MSRCFPFPPPGYERKHRPEDLDLLKEAKRKEKKHKKEKKDKESKKDKEKKEKDGSDEKHRDKKDRKGKHKDKKEKHRDKKKDKEDRGKDKEKSSISEESTVAGKLEEKSEGKLHPKGHSKDRSNFLNEGKCSTLLQAQNGGKPSESSLPSQGNEESKFVQELDRRIRDEKDRGSQLPERVAVVDKRDQEMAARAAIRNSSGVLAEEKGDNKNKIVDRKKDPQGLRNEFSGNTMVQNFTLMAKSKVEGIPRPVDEQNGRRLEDKEKHKETSGVKRGDMQKDRDKESHGKEKDKEKEMKKDDKVKLKTDNKKSEQDKLKDDGRNDTGNKSTDLFKDANSNAVNEGNIRKRKDVGTNGFLHESDIRPNKMQRPAPHQLTENGRKLEPFRTPSKSSHDKHAVPNSVRVDNKDRLMNGIIEAQKPSPSKPNPSAATMVHDQIAEASKIPHRDSNYLKKALTVPKMEDPIAEDSRRHPHPDSKYLAEVLMVPKMADWSENDDQEWLFSKKGPSKPEVESVGFKEDLRVWSEAVHIESADVCALPYVIPY
ncbi:hypothetical protein Pfo_026692 [Paulownia fortunei]|nr:hypothetical protein Pfo_026692 [Paulownia fortunei]